LNLIKFITFKNNVFVAITYHKYISVTSEKDEKLVDSNHGRVGARVLDGRDNLWSSETSLTQVDKRVQHPESKVILSNVEASGVESINSGVVTLKLSEFDVVIEHGASERIVLSYSLHQLVDHTLHEFPVPDQAVQLLFGLLLL